MHWVNIWAYTWYTTEESFHHVAFSGALTEGMGLIPTPSSEVEVAWDAAPTPARLCQRPLERLPPGMYSLTCQVTASSGRFGWDGLKFDKWSPDEMALWRPVDVQWPAIVWHFVLTPPGRPHLTNTPRSKFGHLGRWSSWSHPLCTKMMGNKMTWKRWENWGNFFRFLKIYNKGFNNLTFVEK